MIECIRDMVKGDHFFSETSIQELAECWQLMREQVLCDERGRLMTEARTNYAEPIEFLASFVIEKRSSGSCH